MQLVVGHRDGEALDLQRLYPGHERARRVLVEARGAVRGVNGGVHCEGTGTWIAPIASERSRT